MSIGPRQFWWANKAEEQEYEYLRSEVLWPQPFQNRDGDVVFETDAGNLRMIGGWNGTWVPTTTNEQWESTDGGLTWSQLANAPWQGRHEFPHGWRNDGFFWIWGGDGNQVPTGQTDVWKWSTATGWLLVTPNWGPIAGNRVHQAFCIHQVGGIDYMYLIGGDAGATVVRSSDGINWTLMGNLSNFGYTMNNGYAISHKGYIFIIGSQPGDKYTVWRSSDDGATFTALSTLPTGGTLTPLVNDSTAWNRIWSQWGVLFYINGTGNAGNTIGMFISRDNGMTWKRNPSFPIETAHARGIGSFNDSFYTVAGTFTDFVEKVERIPYVPLTDKIRYSLRKAIPTYSGPAIRIRRSNDGAELDIGFVGNDLDNAAITTFVGGNSAFIRTWYDQTGNNYHITQANNVLLPRIVNAGVLETLNGKTAVKFTATTNVLAYTSDIDLGSQYTFSAVCAPDTTDRVLGASSVSGSYMLYMFNSGNVFYHNNGNPVRQYAQVSIGAPIATTANTQTLVEAYRNRMYGWFYKDGSLRGCSWLTTLSPKAMNARHDSPQSFRRLGNEAGGGSFTGWVQEIIIKTGYVEEDANIAIQADIDAYWNVY